MKSFVATSWELVDMGAAASELTKDIEKNQLMKNSIAVLYCDSELDDYQNLLAQLENALEVPVIGCTSLATINRQNGVSDMSISLLVLTCNDCIFHVALTEPVEKDNVQPVMEKAYHTICTGFQNRPQMAYMIPPHNYEIMIDLYAEVLSELTEGLPVFGGLPGYNAPYGVNAVIYKGQTYTDRLLMLFIEGNIAPVFSVGVEMSHLSGGKHTITSSKDNVIYTIDDMPVPEYLQSIGMDPVKLAQDETDILFVSNPLLLTAPDKPLEDYMLIRTFQALDLEKGCGVSLGLVPQGHNIAIGSLTRRDVHNSAKKSIENLLKQIEEQEARNPGYVYTTIIAISCAGRYMVITPRTEYEGNVFLEDIPDRFKFIGYYSYGEFVPTSITDGIAINTAQNESLVLCAF